MATIRVRIIYQRPDSTFSESTVINVNPKNIARDAREFCENRGWKLISVSSV